MASKTTVAVDQKLRKKIKKLSALLDIPQSAVIEKDTTSEWGYYFAEDIKNADKVLLQGAILKKQYMEY